MKKTFKVGDWVIHGFELKQIKSIDGPYYTVSDGAFETSGQLEMREASYKTKRLADFCRGYYKKLHEDYGRLINNWPDLNRWFEARCLEMIDAMNDEKKLEALCEDTQKFYTEITEDCRARQHTKIRGLNLYSR